MKRIMPEELREKTGIRKSLRSLAATDIVRAFSFVGGFNRHDVQAEFGSIYGENCLDRTLADLEAAGAIECIRTTGKGVPNAVYKVVQDVDSWGARQAEAAEARRHRHYASSAGVH